MGRRTRTTRSTVAQSRSAWAGLVPLVPNGRTPTIASTDEHDGDRAGEGAGG